MSFNLLSTWNNRLITVLISVLLWIVQVESSREANTRALQELSAKLQKEYEEKLLEEQQKHREEIENLQVCNLYLLFIFSHHGTLHKVSLPTDLPLQQDRCLMLAQNTANKPKWLSKLLMNCSLISQTVSKPNRILFTQAQLDEYIRRLEEAERNIKIAEAKIADRDQRIIEVERLLDCMGKVRKISTWKMSNYSFVVQQFLL